MTPEEAAEAVGGYAIARYATGGLEYGRGFVVSYSNVPTVTIETASGERFSWRHDLCEKWEPTGAELTVARMDTYTQEQHREGIEAARERARVRRKERVIERCEVEAVMVGWFSDVDAEQEGESEYVWQPCLETGTGHIPSVGIWFKSKSECDDFIRTTILGHGMLDD